MSGERISVIVEELLEVLRDEDNPVLPAMLGTALDEDLEILSNDEWECDRCKFMHHEERGA